MAPRERLMRFDRRMTDAEALLWNLEKDPRLNSSFANVTILDRPIDFERFRRRIAHAVTVIPRLRQRVTPMLGRLAPPQWTDDPDFDLDFHVRRVGLPTPGTDRQLFDLASLIANDPYDRTRPLWEFVVVDGLEGGRGAMVQKMHHTIADGEGAIRLSEQFIDIARDVPDPEPVESGAAGATDGGDGGGHDGRGPVGLLGTAVETLNHNARRQLGVARRSLEGVAATVVDPRKLPAAGAEAVETARSLVRQVAVIEPARSPLWTTRGLRRRFEVLQVPFDDARRTAKALGGTVNDFFVAGAAGGAGAYHRAKGAEVEALRATMPVSTRRDGSAGGNSWSPTRMLVATDADPVARFRQVHEHLEAAKGERSIGAMDAIAGVVNTLPTSWLVRFARQQVETVDFATSNVRAAPFELYIGGGLILANYPMGPTGGTAWNITTMSYNGSLDMGVNVDADAVDDPELLRRCLAESYEELLHAAP
jgi:WS/DGAT/MGAT family acyltransferase